MKIPFIKTIFNKIKLDDVINVLQFPLKYER